MDAYVVILREIGGEKTIKFIDKETWDWIHSPCPKFTQGSAYDVVPMNVLNRIKANCPDDDYGPNDDSVLITIGSYENNRAIYAPSITGWPVFCGYLISPAKQWANNNNIRVLGFYDGVMY